MDLEIVRSQGSLLPHVALFANKDIAIGDELTFWYGLSESVEQPVRCAECQRQQPMQMAAESTALPSNVYSAINARYARRRCLCGSPVCQGFLPGSYKQH